MPIAHICIRCGTELSFVPTVHDSTIGLPIVQCPKCGRAEVKRLHAVRAHRRLWKRRSAACGYLGVQLFFGFFVLMMLTGVSSAIAEPIVADVQFILRAMEPAYRSRESVTENFTKWWESSRYFVLGVGALTIFSGLWFAMATRHLTTRRRWFKLWLVLMVAAGVFQAGEWLDDHFGRDYWSDNVPAVLHFMAITALVPIAMVGGAMARVTGGLFDRWRRSVVKNHLARMRLKRRST